MASSIDTDKPIIAETFLHSIWMQGMDKIPKEFDENQRTWVSAHMKHYYRVWDAVNITHFIQTNYPKYVSTFRLLKDPFQKMYFGQYLIMYHFGGIMTHMDLKMLRGSFEHSQLKTVHGLALVSSPHSKLKNVVEAAHVQNFSKKLSIKSTFLTTKLMACNKNHPFWIHAIRQMSRQIMASPDEFPNYSLFLRCTAGDLFLSNVYEEYILKAKPAHIYSWKTFFVSLPVSYALNLKDRFLQTLGKSKNPVISKALAPKPINTKTSPKVADELYTFRPPTNDPLIVVVCVVCIVVAVTICWLLLFGKKNQPQPKNVK